MRPVLASPRILEPSAPLRLPVAVNSLDSPGRFALPSRLKQRQWPDQGSTLAHSKCNHQTSMRRLILT